MQEAAATRRVTFGDVLANREFRVLVIAQALSIVGDQLARIAVALLVFARSGSPLLTALAYGVTYLPWLIGGPWLSVYADRLPRRRVMVACDLVRAATVLLIAIPGMPLAMALLVVCLVSLLEPPFTAARSALLADVVPTTSHYATASALGTTVYQLGQVVGFGLGGVVVAAISPRGAIFVDSATFVASAALLLRFVTARPTPRDPDKPGSALTRREALDFITGDRRVRDAVLLAYAVVAASMAPECMAVPYAAAHGGGAIAAGVLTAAVPLGTMLGAVFVGRVLGQDRAERWIRPLAIGTAAAVALTAVNPPMPLAVLIWVVGGACSAMVITSAALVARLTPAGMRGRVFGLIGSGLAAMQGASALMVGWIAEYTGPAVAIADIALPMLGLVVILIARAAGNSRNSSFGPISTEGADQGFPVDESADETEDQNDMPATAGARRSHSAVWALTLVLASVTLGCLPAVLHSEPLVDIGLPLWWVLLLFVISISFPLQFVFRRQPWMVQLEAVPVILGLFFLAPGAFLVARLTATFISMVIRRQPPVRLAFNVAQRAVVTLAVIGVFRLLTVSHHGVHVRNWLAAFAAICVDEFVSAVLMVLVVYLSNREWTFRQSAPAIALSLGVAFINTFLALCTAGALSYDIATAWAISVFVVLSIAAVRTYHRLADRHAALDKLYAVARELGPIAADPGDLAPALTQLRRIIKAETLELAMLGNDRDFATHITVFERETGEGLEVAERALDDGSREVLAIAGKSSSRVSRPANLLARRRMRRSATHIAVPVTTADRPLAVLTARDRSGSVGNFDQSDIRLLEAAADQLSAALEKGRLVESLRRAATRDSLTNLANLDSLRGFLATMLDGSAGGVLLLLDIDRFHEINDTLGHDAGDTILVEVARRLESAPTHGALVARVGGDQFALAIPGQAGGEVARLAALAVKSRVDGPVRFTDVSADLRITIGMARSPEHGTDPATLLRRAEMAMAAAKGTASGIGEWEPGYERDGSRRLQVLTGLRQALTNDEIRVEFQPKLVLGTGAVTGFEALVRWRSEELGAVSPAEFVPLAEASGLISALTTNVLRQSLEATRRWHDAGLRVGVAVNISARSLDDPVLVGQVAAMLTASGIESRWLTLEITESSVMENQARSLEVLHQLRSLGVRLSIDDFGTGYSSLYQLRGLPVHEVKIDKAFTDHVDGDGADRAVVRAIVELCDSLGLATVAEGVENASQAYALESLGVTQVQGYFYGRPMPETDATEWLIPRSIAPAKNPPSDVARG